MHQPDLSITWFRILGHFYVFSLMRQMAQSVYFETAAISIIILTFEYRIIVEIYEKPHGASY